MRVGVFFTFILNLFSFIHGNNPNSCIILGNHAIVKLREHLSYRTNGHDSKILLEQFQWNKWRTDYKQNGITERYQIDWFIHFQTLYSQICSIFISPTNDKALNHSASSTCLGGIFLKGSKCPFREREKMHTDITPIILFAFYFTPTSLLWKTAVEENHLWILLKFSGHYKNREIFFIIWHKIVQQNT